MEDNPEPELILISQRGKKVSGVSKCSECGDYACDVWVYTISSRGKVYICERCKPEVFTRSFGSIDAMSMAVAGGGIDSNRRRH